MEHLIISAVIWSFIWGICVAIIANKKGYETTGWFLYGFFLSIIALVHILASDKKERQKKYWED